MSQVVGSAKEKFIGKRRKGLAELRQKAFDVPLRGEGKATATLPFAVANNS